MREVEVRAHGDQFAMILDQGNNNSNLYVPLTADLYDPDRFVLVAQDGTRYLLDRDAGLVEARDRNGNTVTIDDRNLSIADCRVFIRIGCLVG